MTKLEKKVKIFMLKEEVIHFSPLCKAEKVRKIISHSKEHPSSKNYIKKYLDYIKDDSNIYTPDV